MKKYLITILLLLSSILLADDNYELKLYEKVLPAIFKTPNLTIYTDSYSKTVLQDSSMFKFTSNCKDANLLVGRDFNDLKAECYSLPLFTTSYSSFQNNKNSFGAFYWRKGRPQLKFKLDNMKSYNLELPKSLRKYAK